MFKPIKRTVELDLSIRMYDDITVYSDLEMNFVNEAVDKIKNILEKNNIYAKVTLDGWKVEGY